MIQGLNTPIKGRHVLVVEESILDVWVDYLFTARLFEKEKPAFP